MNSSATRYRLKTGILTVKTPGEEILMDYGSGKYFGLRGAVVHLVDLLRDGADPDQMANALHGIYEIDTTTAQKDVNAILQKLQDAGLVTPE